MTAQALTATMTYAAALEAVVADEMDRDESVCVFSTLVPPGLAQFGPRARTIPISEAAITGVGVGLAATGKRPVVYWRNVTFSFNALDQVINQAAKLQYMLGGQMSLPIVFRAPCGGGDGMAAQHSQSPYSIFAQIAGLKVVVPSSPADAAGLLRAAIRDDNPVVCCEPARLASVAGEVPAGHVVPIGEAEVKRPGTDVTIVAIGSMVAMALDAADELAADGTSVEVVDPRTLAPFDAATIRESVRRTGRLVVADEASPHCSMTAEVAASVVEDRETFRALKAPPARVGALHVPVPFSQPLEEHVLPAAPEVVAAVRETLR
jgi:pyruvate/2-oxoglutarate/acetoin dehydrogenase E1 component